MKLINEFKLLVIVGAWNRNIFTPEWIKKYLLIKEEFNFEVSLNFDGSHRISTEKIRIEFYNNKINFIARSGDLDAHEIISDLSVKIADYLPHTPVSGYGINFVFECNSENFQLDLIKSNDVEKLNEDGIQVISSLHKHTIKINNILINITISNNNGSLHFDFNFHSNVTNLTQFKEKIYELPVEKLYKIALSIMKNTYQAQRNGE